VLSRRGSAAAFGAYAAVAFFVLGLPAIVQSGSRYVGFGYDPQIFIWAFAWFPHAVLHGENPLVTHAVWAPTGLNLTWTTTVPGLALLFSPLTLLFGPIVSYDVAAVLAPAVSAWTGFLLCRYLTRSFWPSLAGGYVFGFSSYVLAQGGRGHLHLSAIFVVPLVALVVLKYLDVRLTGWGLVLRLGPLLGLQLLISTEVAFTLTLALAVALIAAFALVPARRRRLLASLPPIAGGYAFGGLLTAPFVYYLLSGFQGPAFSDADAFAGDLANFVVPTIVTVGGRWLGGVASRFPGNPSEQDAYLGIPLLVIVALFARERFRTAGGRFLLACLAIGVVVALGPRVIVAGRSTVWAPWALVHTQKLFDNVFASRLTVFVALAAAVVVALWTAAQRPGTLRWLLPVLAILALAPDPIAGGFATPYHVPAFFTAAAYKNCLDPGEIVVPFPYRGGFVLLQQADRSFRWDMAGGDLGPAIPAPFLTQVALPIVGGGPLGADQAANLRQFLTQMHVTTVVVDADQADQWSAALDQIATPHRVDGVVLYHLQRFPPPCPATR
jgi:hypothetical protein